MKLDTAELRALGRRRPPRGGRGLKPVIRRGIWTGESVAPRAGGVD